MALLEVDRFFCHERISAADDRRPLQILKARFDGLRGLLGAAEDVVDDDLGLRVATCGTADILGFLHVLRLANGGAGAGEVLRLGGVLRVVFGVVVEPVV